MKVEIVDGCIGCGMCESICSDVFRLEDDGYAHVIKEPSGNEELVKEAASNCPVEVIIVE